MKQSFEDIKYVCQIIYESYRLSVFYINPSGNFELEFSLIDFQSSPYYIPLKEQIKAYSYQQHPSDFPIFISHSKLHFFFINLEEDKQFLGTIIIGPCLPSKLNDEKIRGIVNTFKENMNKRVLLQFY